MGAEAEAGLVLSSLLCWPLPIVCFSQFVVATTGRMVCGLQSLSAVSKVALNYAVPVLVRRLALLLFVMFFFYLHLDLIP